MLAEQKSAPMPKPVYTITLHKGTSRIKISFEKNDEWNRRIKNVVGAAWSKTHKAWLIPDTPPNRQKCGLPALPAATSIQQQQAAVQKQPAAHTGKPQVQHISEENFAQLKQYMQHLQLKAYSHSTIRTYRNEFGNFLQALKQTPAKGLSTQRIKDYLQYCHAVLHLSENTLHSRMNALKFYYEQVLRKEKFFWEIPRPKKRLILPKVLNETELKRMFASIQNIKHKAILFTAYSAGLRVSETVHLRLQDIDSTRMQIFVNQAKGKKDRVVNLSILVLDVLRQYIKFQQPRPTYYLFTGPDGKEPYSERSAQKIFQRAKTEAGIKKELGFHSLRHSFATHLLEKGIDVKYIKELLGHFDIRTTERYLHVAKDKLVNIISPLDSLYNDEN